MKKVQVLLSTYNGVEYLEPQLDSLLAQDYHDVEILIRDDGSSDATPSIIQEYAQANSNIKLWLEDNIGVMSSFFRLLQLSSPEADVFAFCDQDDVWQKNKVSRTVEIISQGSSDSPRLYCSRTTLVDEGLNVIGYSDAPKRGLSFNNALVQNVVTGCTLAINNDARKLILKELPSPDRVPIHDWWMYLVISALGEVMYDAESGILYRQHSSNVIGDNTRNWIFRGNHVLTRDHMMCVRQAREFERIHGDALSLSKRRILDRFMNYRDQFFKRARYALSGDVYRHTILDNLVLKVLIVLKWT